MSASQSREPGFESPFETLLPFSLSPRRPSSLSWFKLLPSRKGWIPYLIRTVQGQLVLVDWPLCQYWGWLLSWEQWYQFQFPTTIFIVLQCQSRYRPIKDKNHPCRLAFRIAGTSNNVRCSHLLFICHVLESVSDFDSILVTDTVHSFYQC